MKLRLKIFLAITGLIVAAMTFLSVPLYWYARGALEDEVDRNLRLRILLMVEQLDLQLVDPLTGPAELPALRMALKKQLMDLCHPDVMAAGVYSSSGQKLAFYSRQDGFESTNPLSPSSRGEPLVSAGIKTPGSGTLKAAAIRIRTTEAELVIWGGAEYLSDVDQLAGSLLWILLLSLVAGAGLAYIFSLALIRPMDHLAGYTDRIKRSIYTPPVDLGRQDEIGSLNQALIEMHSEIRHNEQRNKQLLAGIAHEIKNPLGGIEIYSGLLEEELESNDEQRDYLRRIITEVQNLKRIVLDYLDFARPPKSDIKPQKIETAVADAARLLQPEFDQRSIEFDISGSGTIAADESKLRRLALNLLKNSLEAVESSGKITVVIDEDNTNFIIKFTDTGSGMETDLQRRIFDPHFTTRDKGYGLGLPLVKKIVDEMNGTIVVESAPGQGSEFQLTLPKNQ